ncbi:MAG TPA: T9SS type A sorting domain-containing protein, partial [Parafilimonas sp.]
TGLKTGSVYYYRVRASNSSNKSDNSNVIIASTCKKPIITNVNINNVSCNGSNDGFINFTDTGSIGTIAYSWTSDNNFTSTNQNINNLSAGMYSVTITANGGCATDTSVLITEPLPVSSTIEVAPFSCSGNSTTLTITATGGTGNYHYTLFDGTNTTGPQDDNHFTVSAGNYTVTVEDDNHCSFTTTSIEVDAPAAIEASASADPITCSGGTTILTVTATGGTGDYHYTLSDGTNTTGPQNNNYFTVSAGNYTVTVTDDNGCPNNLSITIDDGTEICNGFASMNNKSKIHNTKSVIKNREFKVDVFPNPSSNYFLLKINTSSNEKIEIFVTDVYGKKVYQYEDNSKEKYLLGQELSSGIYFVKIIQGESIKTLKLIKQK